MKISSFYGWGNLLSERWSDLSRVKLSRNSRLCPLDTNMGGPIPFHDVGNWFPVTHWSTITTIGLVYPKAVIIPVDDIFSSTHANHPGFFIKVPPPCLCSHCSFPEICHIHKTLSLYLDVTWILLHQSYPLDSFTIHPLGSPSLLASPLSLLNQKFQRDVGGVYPCLQNPREGLRLSRVRVFSPSWRVNHSWALSNTYSILTDYSYVLPKSSDSFLSKCQLIQPTINVGPYSDADRKRTFFQWWNWGTMLHAPLPTTHTTTMPDTIQTDWILF